jgi:hypothetical protein
MNLEVFDFLEANCEEHFKWYEELNQDDKEPDRNHIGRPEEEERVKHI